MTQIIDHKYRVIKLVGSGGMAHVYKAINMANRKTVAIKVLSLLLSDIAKTH